MNRLTAQSFLFLVLALENFHQIPQGLVVVLDWIPGFVVRLNSSNN
jgi:F0F1-type ATP synthase membrane subunit a